ncbi:hypothetical protein HYW74_02390 [Candidatus Pacearchaeota archaeon]|nr:hypothetical protein [Candidatus Pacearchaeota archaeon]
MGNSNKLIAIITLAVLVIININLAFALGVNAPYWQENPLKMSSGETREVAFPLANGINEPTTEATVSITKGSEIATITSEDKYTVSPGENNKNIIIKITIPESAKIGDNYTIGFKVLYTPAGGEGNVKLNVEYNVDFPVEIVSQSEISSVIKTANIPPAEANKSNISYITIVIAIISVLIIIFIIISIFFLIKKRNKQVA